jgi:ABC-type Mn2+/Zn2+ transport system ATPase subunit
MTNFDYEQYPDDLVDIIDSIDCTKITILTGRNAGGKSLIRKLMSGEVRKQSGKDKIRIPHASQQLRTEVNPELGALGSFAHDLEWLATSTSTISNIEKAFKVEGADYLVIDEPEIGVGEELQLGLADWLNDKLVDYPKGVLIICHSRLLVQNIKHNHFINLEGMSFDEWTSRVPVKLPVEDFLEFSGEMFKRVKKRLKS